MVSDASRFDGTALAIGRQSNVTLAIP